MKLDFMVGISRTRPVKDVVEIGVGIAGGESVTDKATGAAAGDVVSKVTAGVLDGKSGRAAASAMGAVAGKLAAMQSKPARQCKPQIHVTISSHPVASIFVISDGVVIYCRI